MIQDKKHNVLSTLILKYDSSFQQLIIFIILITELDKSSLVKMGKFVDIDDDNVRQRIKQLTEDYLGGRWSTIDQNDIKIRRIA